MAAALAHLIATAGLLPVLAAVAAIYFAALAVYRLYLHPLAKFPGPRLAAVTSWYEGYYEIVKNGQYSRQISNLHDQYGTACQSFASVWPLLLTCHHRAHHSRHPS